MNPPTRPVLIVGAGPTGLTAAMELARFGIAVRLIDKLPSPEKTSRAIGVQARTLELFEQRGLADEMMRIGNAAEATNVYSGGKRIFRLNFSHVDSRYSRILLISQAETERILREQLARQGVTIERPVEMIALAQKGPRQAGEEGGVSATLRHQDGSLEEVEAAYLISAEGAHSTVRSTLCLEFQGKSFDQDYTLGDLHAEGDLPSTDLHIFASEYGFMAMFPLGGDHFRLIASDPLSKPRQGAAPSLEELQKMYDTRSHIPARLHDMTWSSWFRINSRMIDRLQHERIFLGGDSAHIHSPAGGQGMNTGIQDMINLGWKLAFVMQGKASSKLLATYSDDRLPVIHNVLRGTETLTEAIGAENAAFRSIFAHVAPLLVASDFMQEKATSQMSQVAINYRHSPLSEPHGHFGELRAGDRIPDMTLSVMTKGGGSDSASQSARLFSLLDPSRFTLLYVNPRDRASSHPESEADLSAWQNILSSRAIAALGNAGAESRHFTDKFGSEPGLILVRPDGYIAFLQSGSALPDLISYLQRWFPPASDAMRKNS